MYMGVMKPEVWNKKAAKLPTKRFKFCIGDYVRISSIKRTF